MKKLTVIAVILVITMGLLSACAEKQAAEVSAPSAEIVGESVEIAVETLTSTDGYAIVLGTLVEQDHHHVVIKTNDNYDLDFKLAPETVVYPGEDAEKLVQGDEVAVVFEGELDGLNTEGVRVITISISAEEEDYLQEE